MPQKTNLNISPYYDDFSKDNQFYRVLFNPGRPVQARELSTLQSILQEQQVKILRMLFQPQDLLQREQIIKVSIM